MAYLATDKMIGSSCSSIYKLVILAAKRGLEIAEGQPKLVEANVNVKPATVALMEITAGLISCKRIKPKE